MITEIASVEYYMIVYMCIIGQDSPLLENSYGEKFSVSTHKYILCVRMLCMIAWNTYFLAEIFFLYDTIRERKQYPFRKVQEKILDKRRDVWLKSFRK